MKHFKPFLIFLLVSPLIFGSCYGKKALKLYQVGIEQEPFDAIIVPGIPFEGEKWEDVMKLRVYWSKYLYERGYTKNIIYSGSAVYTPYIESRIMSKYGQALGIPLDHIFTEEEAEHSTENLYYSLKLAEKQGFEKVALASDPFQSVLLHSFAKKEKMEVMFLPALIDSLIKIEKIDPEINPTSAFVENFVSLPDRESRWKRFKGTMGKNIKYRD